MEQSINYIFWNLQRSVTEWVKHNAVDAIVKISLIEKNICFYGTRMRYFAQIQFVKRGKADVKAFEVSILFAKIALLKLKW